eukprot:COSAG02_NODE_11869_length_1638_cov_1.138402_1_plen_102_part_00
MWRRLQVDQSDGSFTGEGSDAGGVDSSATLGDKLGDRTAAAAAAALGAGVDFAGDVAGGIADTLGPGVAMMLDVWPHACTVLSLLSALYVVVATGLHTVRM